MNKIFRSRGFRLNFVPNFEIEEKIYFSTDSKLIELLNVDIPQDILTLFEYSVKTGSEDDTIDSLNFHVDLTRDTSKIYLDVPNNVLNILNSVPDIFDETFLNYTLGYRIKNSVNVGRTFYFYPTVWKGNRYGIKGVVDKQEIEKFLKRFLNYFQIKDNISLILIEKFFNLIYKFKGFSITVDNFNVRNLKIYARLNEENYFDLFTFMRNLGLIDDEQILISMKEKYGCSVLVALRLISNSVSGLNLYFLQ